MASSRETAEKLPCPSFLSGVVKRSSEYADAVYPSPRTHRCPWANGWFSRPMNRHNAPSCVHVPMPHLFPQPSHVVAAYSTTWSSPHAKASLRKPPTPTPPNAAAAPTAAPAARNERLVRALSGISRSPSCVVDCLSCIATCLCKRPSRLAHAMRLSKRRKRIIPTMQRLAHAPFKGKYLQYPLGWYAFVLGFCKNIRQRHPRCQRRSTRAS